MMLLKVLLQIQITVLGLLNEFLLLNARLCGRKIRIKESIDTAYLSSPIQKVTAVSYLQCVHSCFHGPRPCLSLNFQTKKMGGTYSCICFANGYNDDESTLLVKRQGWVYSWVVLEDPTVVLKDFWAIQQQYIYCDPSEAIYRTCSQALSFNQGRSAYYKIQLDKRGTNFTVSLYCRFRKKKAEVVLRPYYLALNNFSSGVEIGKGFIVNVSYGFTKDQMMAITENSNYCQQHISIGCRHVRVTGFAAWTSAAGEEVLYIGNGTRGQNGCDCGRSGTCYDRDKICNCDTNDEVWREDKGYLSEKSLLPLKQMKFGDMGSPGERISFTLGNLECRF